ncbi:hypothetical protein ZHAS_00009463 [Anopheles sinensis]|uniref:Uncharacterized protein n=1 Tax=Anopheles sinensis TaxID=74873 RepID=A0A084VVA9_ANOSI|nr:hypothetical protein ZHAS_00009463 [Anopheles sinensis]
MSNVGPSSGRISRLLRSKGRKRDRQEDTDPSGLSSVDEGFPFPALPCPGFLLFYVPLPRKVCFPFLQRKDCPGRGAHPI